MTVRTNNAPRVPSRNARNFIFAPLRIGSGNLGGQHPLTQLHGAADSDKINSATCRSGVIPFVVSHSEPVLRAITAATRLNGSSAMRFMYIVTSPQPDKGPTPALMEAMGKLADREIK